MPYKLVHEEVEAQLCGDVVEILHGRARVAAHRRSSVKGGFTTITDHMPSAHRAQAEWTLSRIVSWAGKVGASTHALCEAKRGGCSCKTTGVNSNGLGAAGLLIGLAAFASRRRR